MPCYMAGPIILNSNEGQIITGDTFYVAPVSTSKVVTGSGSFNTGYWINSNNGSSTSNAFDPEIVDQNTDGLDL